MKKKYRDKALNELINELNNKDFDYRENALFQLGLLLERSNKGDTLANIPDIYSDNLSRELLRLSLSDKEQNRVIDSLSRMIATENESRPTAFWALGKAKGELAFAPLLSLIQATGYRLNNEASFQACDALQSWLQAGLAGDKNRAEQLKLQDPTPILQSWLESSDDRLVASAEDVLDMLEG
jgi:hypothetical protein